MAILTHTPSTVVQPSTNPPFSPTGQPLKELIRWPWSYPTKVLPVKILDRLNCFFGLHHDHIQFILEWDDHSRLTNLLFLRQLDARLLLKKNDPLCRNLIEVCRLAILTKEKKVDGDYGQRILHSLIRNLANEIGNEPSTVSLPSLLAVLALAYITLGDIAMEQKQFSDAAKMFKQSKPYSRSAKLRTFQSILDEALALAQMGEFVRAKRLILIDLISFRTDLSNEQVAQAYNLLARTELLAGNYFEAESYVKLAMDNLNTIRKSSEKSLAFLLLAQISRLQSERPDLPNSQKVILLEKGLTACEEGARACCKGSAHRERQSELLYQHGLIYRDISRLQQQPRMSDAYQQATQLLTLADKLALADQNQLGRIKLRLGLAYTHYYAANSAELDQLLIETASMIEIVRNQLANCSNHQDCEGVLTSIAPQLGRWHILQGLIKFDELQARELVTTKEDYLKLVEHFAVALDFNSINGKTSQGYQRAVVAIFNRFESLETNQLKAVFEALEETSDRESHLWQELEEVYGPYDLIRILAQ